MGYNGRLRKVTCASWNVKPAMEFQAQAADVAECLEWSLQSLMELSRSRGRKLWTAQGWGSRVTVNSLMFE